MASLIVVGGGFFGMTAARMAQRAGWDVIVVDDGRPYAGSPPAAGLIKPSWLDGFGKAGKFGLIALDDLFGLQTLEFVVKKGPVEIKTTLKFIHPQRILNKRDISVVHAKATQVGDGWVALQGGERLHGYVYVATGSWANELVAECPPVKRLRGSAFIFAGQCKKNLLVPWAPYKQIKVFSPERGVIWTGDSTGVKPESYTPERQHASLMRCASAAGLDDSEHGEAKTRSFKTLTGDRPVVEGHKEGYFAAIGDRSWVGTGGGKMGATLAGYHATLLMEQLKGRR